MARMSLTLRLMDRYMTMEQKSGPAVMKPIMDCTPGPDGAPEAVVRLILNQIMPYSSARKSTMKRRIGMTLGERASSKKVREKTK